MQTFPTLRLAVVQGMLDLKRQFDADPEYFRSKECPYDDETNEMLEQIFASRIVEVEKFVEVKVPVEVSEEEQAARREKLTEEEQELVNKTVGDMLKDLNKLGDGETGLDTQTKVAIIKAKATLIDQMLKMHERVMNVKRIANFQTVVLSILDDLIPADDRHIFLTRMEPYLD